MRVYEITWKEITAYIAAEKAGKARMIAARSIQDCFQVKIGEALKQMRCRRAPWKDCDVETRGRDGFLPEIGS